MDPQPILVTIRDSGDCIRDLVYSYSATITERGLPKWGPMNFGRGALENDNNKHINSMSLYGETDEAFLSYLRFLSLWRSFLIIAHVTSDTEIVTKDWLSSML